MSFRENALAMLALCGMDDPPEGYMRNLEALDSACAKAWQEMQGQHPVFNLPQLPFKSTTTPLYAGPLNLAVKWCGNDAARKFVERADELSGRRCSIFMLQILLALQTAYQDSKVNAKGGES